MGIFFYTKNFAFFTPYFFFFFKPIFYNRNFNFLHQVFHTNIFAFLHTKFLNLENDFWKEIYVLEKLVQKNFRIKIGVNKVYPLHPNPKYFYNSQKNETKA